MKILSIDQAEDVGSFDVEEGVVSFKVDNSDKTLEEALLWVSAQETVGLKGGGENPEGVFYTDVTQIKPGADGYFDAVSEFLYDYGYYIDLEPEAVAG